MSVLRATPTPSIFTVEDAVVNLASASVVPETMPFLSPPASPVLHENWLLFRAMLLPPSAVTVVLPSARSADLALFP
nr:hypothetical protein [Photobacterium salinisoli]